MWSTWSTRRSAAYRKMTTATNNYFKSSSGEVAFFVDTVPESIADAYEYIVEFGSSPTVYRAIGIPGSWDTCKIIGHRDATEIMSDLHMEQDIEERLRLRSEMAALKAAYSKVGRDLPQAMAA